MRACVVLRSYRSPGWEVTRMASGDSEWSVAPVDGGELAEVAEVEVT